MAIAVSVFVVLLRAVFAATWFMGPFNWISFLFGCIECSALTFTVCGLIWGKVDKSRGSWVVPFYYLAPLMLVRAPAVGPEVLDAALAVLLVLQWPVLIWLGYRCTIGVPVFRSLVATGPYRFVRHPLSALQVLTVVAYVARYTSTWNVFVLVLKLFTAAACVLREESFLRSQECYREYCGAVRWRWLPGVW